MTLDEAIQHAEEVAMSGCTECHKEHGQLAEWLKDYREMKSKYAPVIHAKWIIHKGLIYRYGECSNCHNYLEIVRVNGGRGDANYCPNCGAKMEE